MKMILEIYKNAEKVNEITTEDEKEIFKNLTQIFFAKEFKRATRSKIEYLCNNNYKIMQIYDQNKTQMQGVKYIYKYRFEDIKI